MNEHYDVVVVGAGPAGLAAAQAAASQGARVGLLDAQMRHGGQVWRHDVRRTAPRAARQAVMALEHMPGRVDWLAQHQVTAGAAGILRVETPNQTKLLTFNALVLATGARELALPFPGWTLPGVTGAGGLQALTKQGWPIAGKRVVVAGSGPLLLAAAHTLRRHGAHVLGLYEQASAASVNAFARQLWRWPKRAGQALALRSSLLGIPYRFGAFVCAAHGQPSLQGVSIRDARGTHRLECDHLAIGYGLVPNVELASLLGCSMDNRGTHPCVQVDELLRSSHDNVFAAGESCGIAGLAAARIEGRMAGYMAVGCQHDAAALKPARAHERHFAEVLAHHFALDPQLRELATGHTTICRCEDISLATLDGFANAREARLATRCGMGACQGRICGTALAELGRFARSEPRSPLFPTRLATLAGADMSHHPFDNQGIQA
ncbi:MAG: FAD-dependent oxidoreductase [Rhodanobacter sp.]